MGSSPALPLPGFSPLTHALSCVVRFDNSGQKMPFPQWHSYSTNIARTNAVIKTIISMFKDQASTVPVIAPLNELRVVDCSLSPSDH